MNDIMNFPTKRLRRFRQNETIRDMIASPMPGPEKFIWPVFVVEGKGVKEPILSMPGQFRYSIDQLLEAINEVMGMGINSIMLFGVVSDDKKSESAEYAYSKNGLVQRAIFEIKSKFSNLLIFTDVCVCEYTSHGHCGILDDNGYLQNDCSIELLAKTALSYAKAGSDGVAPSAMLDGQVLAIRKALDDGGFVNNILMSYSTKFASSMYGPFRDAADSAPSSGDRKSYQADYRNIRDAINESHLDEAEGADILMVKPSLLYLDIVKQLKEETSRPLAVYNVSGEYSMLIATADRGWGDLKEMVRESTFALSRSGADIIISYWANQYDQFLL